MTGPVVIDVAQDLLRRWPQLRTPAAPVSVKPSGRRLDPAREGVWKLNPVWRRRLIRAAELAHAAGPIVATGACMGAELPDPALLWIDSKIAPAGGDMVVVHARDSDMRALLAIGAQSPDWSAEYADTTLANVWTKQLQYVHGHPYLVTDHGALPFGSCVILGVVVHVVDRDLLDARTPGVAQALLAAPPRPRTIPITFDDLQGLLRAHELECRNDD
jgi:hypothetical protein